jgi:hypothetical protein
MFKHFLILLHIHIRSLFWPGTCTLIKIGRVKLVLCIKCINTNNMVSDLCVFSDEYIDYLIVQSSAHIFHIYMIFRQSELSNASVNWNFAEIFSTLRNHRIAMHTKDYPYRCHICGNGFVLPCQLKQHITRPHITHSKLSLPVIWW